MTTLNLRVHHPHCCGGRDSLSTQWSTNISSKVNLRHAIHFRVCLVHIWSHTPPIVGGAKTAQHTVWLECGVQGPLTRLQRTRLDRNWIHYFNLKSKWSFHPGYPGTKVARSLLRGKTPRQLIVQARNLIAVKRMWNTQDSQGQILHANPYVGVSRPRSWSHLPVLGAISWAFIAKY